MKKLNCVLLIDDDTINNYINERLIKKNEVASEVKVVLNGQEALQYLIDRKKEEGSKNPELILLDINMPVMDGFEFMAAYKKAENIDKESVVIVMLTTSTNPSDTQRLNDSGVAGFVNKPLTEGKLKNLLGTHFV
jgi:CheY-like chemotaxis protein